MSDTVVDATDRFNAGREQRKQHKRPTPLDSLRLTKRVICNDRAMLATRLGEVAARTAPDRPQAAAKKWFDQAWQGDRWAKRKRLIRLPGEAAPDPRDEGAYVASGADWAALIEQAAKATYPAEGSTAEKERERFARDMLRGSAFLPALSPVPLLAENAQSPGRMDASDHGQDRAPQRLTSAMGCFNDDAIWHRVLRLGAPRT